MWTVSVEFLPSLTECTRWPLLYNQWEEGPTCFTLSGLSEDFITGNHYAQINHSKEYWKKEINDKCLYFILIFVTFKTNTLNIYKPWRGVLGLQQCLGRRQSNIQMNARTQGFPAEHCPEHHTASAGLPSSHSASWCHPYCIPILVHHAPIAWTFSGAQGLALPLRPVSGKH